MDSRLGDRIKNERRLEPAIAVRVLVQRQMGETVGKVQRRPQPERLRGSAPDDSSPVACQRDARPTIGREFRAHRPDRCAVRHRRR